MGDDRRAIKIDADLFDKLRMDKEAIGVSWDAYLRMLASSPEPIFIEDEQVEEIAELSAERVVERMEG